MINPYLDEFRQLQKKNNFKGQQWFGERSTLVERYGWAVPNESAITYLTNFDNLIEVGAGSGYWAYIIESAGGSVDAYDIDPPGANENEYVNVEKSDVRSMEVIENSPVLMVWPPCHNKMSEYVLTHEPSHVLYVGEGAGGCTGTDEFHHTLSKKYGLIETIEIPSFDGVNDNLYHYARNV